MLGGSATVWIGTMTPLAASVTPAINSARKRVVSGVTTTRASARNSEMTSASLCYTSRVQGVLRERITSSDWSEMDLGHSTPCWIWNGRAKNRDGHCSVWIRGKEYSAHRRMYEQEVGSIPDGLELDHLCCQPSCIRPEHLEAVTHAVNSRRSSLAKITPEIAQAIRDCPLSCRKAAPLFGVSYSTIASVRRGHTWS